MSDWSISHGAPTMLPNDSAASSPDLKKESQIQLLSLGCSSDAMMSDVDLEAGGTDFFKNTSVSSLSWRDVTVHVKHRKTGEQMPILSACSGRVEAGQVMALMGPSGSGKTTMLNVLASRSKVGHTGSIRVNERPIVGASIQEISSYVQQDDVHIGGLTVEETIAFTSRLASRDMTKVQRKQHDDQVIRALGLEGQRETLISSPFRASLSGGQKRRLSLATALVTAPRILFLDEPTSGLDSAASHEVMSFVSRFARRYGLIVIASIHQPSSSIFGLFDSVMLISNGKTCYFGPREGMRPHFADVAPIPYEVNPAEYLLDAVNTDFIREDPRHGDRVLAIMEKWQNVEKTALLDSSEVASEQVLNLGQRLSAPFSRSCWILLHRNYVKSYRDPLVYGTRLLINIALAVVTGTVWLRLPYHQSSIQPVINCLFFSSAFMSLIAVAYAPAIIEDIRMLQKEYANRLYRPLPFIIANFLIGLPWLALVAFVFSTLVYWLSNLSPTGSGFATFFMWLFVDLIAAESLVVLVATVVPQFVTSLALVSFANGLWLAVGGFLVPVGLLNSFWRYAFHYIDFQTYVFQGLMVNQFSDTIYDCSRENGKVFCMYPSDLASQAQIRGAAILDGYKYGHRPYEWVQWLGISLAIVFAHRLLGWALLCWRVRR